MLGKSWAFFFTKFYKTFIAWEHGILNPTLFWGWWQDYTSQVTPFTVKKNWMLRQQDRVCFVKGKQQMASNNSGSNIL